ncbi:ABC transporter ATP-binding protein [Actinomadura litoris]|uniref:ATP-binding cassette domain-containing protein n=1 Tax=Actinomadura litoris TaxID=2678616 RepID=A0A7K1L2E1_9ACTN|nr:ABC transporter ATP-binding protein [Actinomadura litoris]MUN38618.1 ATP-binding cassette domain-containing protein [Actinomadura litoris]
MERAAVRLRGVGKRFDGGVEAMRDLDLSVAPGEFVSIVGASGCGKSTLLRVIAGLVPGSEGTVEVHGEPVTGPREDVGLMFQRPALLPWKTSLENVLLPIRVRRRITHDDVREAMRLLTLFDLEGFEHGFPSQLSGGMRQRVALARLMMTGAGVRLLDEPFGAVDELTRETLNLHLLRVHERTASATVLVTHTISEAVLMSDRVIVMTSRPGTVAAEVPIPLERPRSPEMAYSQRFQELALTVRRALGPSGSEGGRPS